MKIILLNAGSSSLKASVLDANDGSVVACGQADWKAGGAHYQFVGPEGATSVLHNVESGYSSAVQQFVEDWENVRTRFFPTEPAPVAVGHRVVHGGPFTTSVRINADVRLRISKLADLAPLHNPPSLETMAAAETAFPEIPHIAVFDTAFHSTIPPEMHTYPVPDEWTTYWGIRRFGFHGLSHAYCARRAAELLGRTETGLRLVICHLGHGCSATAVLDGRSIDTTMGYTPLEGLMMATRCGSIDPGLLLYVMQCHDLKPEQLDEILNRKSGLLGVSAISSDMRELLDAARVGHEKARLAIAMYIQRVRQTIGSLTVTLGGIDALVFTAGVGEHSAEIRNSISEGLECIGLQIDRDANHMCNPDTDVATENSASRILVIKTREDLTMLHEVINVLNRETEN
ncbi:MAG: acetate/propionate family kinase [Gimesia chilikensis]|uniref:acetate/propionate family kinase n=1 Tax=Gimesia chilikensis TaxID=2605989 RepID=UPI0037A1FD81